MTAIQIGDVWAVNSGWCYEVTEKRGEVFVGLNISPRANFGHIVIYWGEDGRAVAPTDRREYDMKLRIGKAIREKPMRIDTFGGALAALLLGSMIVIGLVWLIWGA